MSGTALATQQFDDVEYTKFRQNLLRNKGGANQTQFLEQVRTSASFLERMSEIKTEPSTKVELAPWPLTESEFKDPPADTEETLHRFWAGVKPSLACRSTFWASLTLEHIRHERIQSSYLAANGGSLPGGAERIDIALNDSSEEAAKLVDSCVRTVLRRLGGLPEVRGNRSVYVDCPFARAWWREKMVRQAGGGDPQIEKHARAALRVSQTYWEKFIDRIVFRNSTFGSANIRGAFICELGRAVSNGADSIKDTATLQRLCRRVAAIQGQRELGVLDERALTEIMQTVIAGAWV